MAESGDIQTTGSRVVYESRWMRIREDSIRHRDGSEGIFGVVEKPDFVVAAESDGRLHLVQQFRYPVSARYWEFPQGAWEATLDADPLEVARGELKEETGLEATTMSFVGYLFQGYGYSTQGYHIFLAHGLSRGEAALELEEQDLITQVFAAAEVERMICDGDIKDATTVATFGLLRLRGLL
jgi:8-oxo-dGTP pyrophosphatase MutT (NUDIX family)